MAGALRLIEHGLLDDGTVATLAERVGVGETPPAPPVRRNTSAPAARRWPRRGACCSPSKLLRENRAADHQVASAAGYASLRRFNAAFVDTYGKAPRAISAGPRRRLSSLAKSCCGCRTAAVRLRRIDGFFVRRAIPGVEQVSPQHYRSSIVVDGEPGWFEVTPREGDDALSLRVSVARASQLGRVVATVRRQFDVDADPASIRDVLGRSSLLHAATTRWPGQRLPGAWDGFELAVRGFPSNQRGGARTFQRARSSPGDLHWANSASTA